MKLGLITDIHNDAIRLRQALELLADRKVDQIISIGDTFDPLADPAGMEEVAELLTAHRVHGVWGNHDFIFCRDTPKKYFKRYPTKSKRT
jgi:predicted phosphodiesterase